MKHALGWTTQEKGGREHLVRAGKHRQGVCGAKGLLGGTTMQPQERACDVCRTRSARYAYFYTTRKGEATEVSVLLSKHREVVKHSTDLSHTELEAYLREMEEKGKDTSGMRITRMWMLPVKKLLK